MTLQLTTSADGEDYTGTVPTTVMLRSGDDTSYFRLDVLGDDVIETDEDIAVSITGTSRADVNVEPSASTATYTIENDDLASTVSIGVARVGSGDLPTTASSFAEGNSGSYDLAFTVTRSGDLSGAVTVALAAIGSFNAADVTGLIPETVELADGEASTTFFVSVNGDADLEADDDVAVEVVSTDRANVMIDPAAASATHTILNDDVANLAPIGVDDRGDIETNGSVLIDVLENDSDPEGGPVILISVAAPSVGTASVVAEGIVEYTPPTGFIGSDRSFT